MKCLGISNTETYSVEDVQVVLTLRPQWIAAAMGNAALLQRRNPLWAPAHNESAATTHRFAVIAVVATAIHCGHPLRPHYTPRVWKPFGNKRAPRKKRLSRGNNGGKGGPSAFCSIPFRDLCGGGANCSMEDLPTLDVTTFVRSDARVRRLSQM